MTLWRVAVQRSTVESTCVYCEAPDKKAAVIEAVRMIEEDDCETPFGQAEWYADESENGELEIVEVQKV